MTEPAAHAAGSFEIVGKKAARLGFRAMRLTGFGVWGEPDDRAECVRVVRRAVELDVQFIDTADSYGPHVSEEIIREPTHPRKAAVDQLTRTWAREYGPSGVRVNAVVPGIIETEGVQAGLGEDRTAYVAITPLGRVGRPEEVANAVAFLASDEASFVNGPGLPKLTPGAK